MVPSLKLPSWQKEEEKQQQQQWEQEGSAVTVCEKGPENNSAPLSWAKRALMQTGVGRSGCSEIGPNVSPPS